MVTKRGKAEPAVADGAVGGFPEGLPESDGARWAEMTPSQRSNAAARLAAFQGWQSGAMELDAAVGASGLSLSRFYRLAADWRASPSLAALGAFAGSGAARSRLDPDAVNALQAVVADVVALNDGASVSQLVRMMVERAGVEESLLPSTGKLRQIVEDEVRRVAATGEAGHTVLLDCTAINLPQSNGRPFVMFAVIDKGTRLVLGSAVASTPDATLGYPRAARDASARIGSGPALPWALRTAQMMIVAGADIQASAALRASIMESRAGAQVLMSQKPRRYGRYFREVVGERIGRISITPGRTEEGSALSDNGDMTPWSEGEAAAAVTQAVEQHNAGILAGLQDGTGTRMPDLLEAALEVLAAVR